ncbi:hypothetical protein ACM55F_08890 [Flavobacterium sp. XS2P12]|uniref:hypothetical protein n=1 Tax=Flavobacterium melibiosi TaxID=3398734 RepID=UPI003A8B57F5
MKTLRQFSLKPVLIIIKINSAYAPSMHNLKTGYLPNGVTPIDNQNSVTIIVTDGTLKIDLYCDSSPNETIDFKVVNFSFEENNLLTVSDGINTYKGNWSITDNNGYIDTLANLKFDISFNCPLNFIETIDHWEIIDKSSGTIQKDVIYGIGEKDFPTFCKN